MPTIKITGPDGAATFERDVPPGKWPGVASILSEAQIKIPQSAIDVLGSEHIKPGHVFLLDRASDKWRPVGLDESVDISSGDEKFIVLTTAELMALVGRTADYSGRDMIVLNAALHIRDSIMSNPNLSEKEKRRLIQRLRADKDGKLAHMAVAQDEIASREASTKATSALLFLIRTFGGRPLVMQRPVGSVFYKARAAFADKTMIMPIAGMTSDGTLISDLSSGMRNAYGGEHQIFVVEHDWAGAFARAVDFDGGALKLPFPNCAFEFQVNDARVVVTLADVPTDDPDADRWGIERTAILTVQTPEGWAMPGCYEYRDGRLRVPDAAHTKADLEKTEFHRALVPLLDLISAQVRAVLISLEAEAAVAEIVRTPYKLNRRREREGKKPFLDYHVVSLARRHRTPPVPAELRSEDDRRASPRLHFRRGHNRHYANYSVWIKWQLVGNPDLGFIDKHYKL